MVWPIAQRQFEETLLGQVHKGLVKYDTTLQTFNQRDSYADLLQEKVDDLMYTTQLYLEAQAFVRLTKTALHLFGGQPIGMDEQHEYAINDFMREARTCLKQSGLSQSQNPSQTSSSSRQT